MKHRFDKSLIRQVASEKEIPIVDLIMDAINKIFEKTEERMTLLSVCPNSMSVVRSALRSAKNFNAPLCFVATLNQVDLDSGYTKWTQYDFVQVVKEETKKVGFNGPIIIALDHGGPWLKDKQALENWSFDKAMNGVKKSLIACLEAGYDLLHIDTTVDKTLPKRESLKIEMVAERTLDLITYVEKARRERKLPKISYEVGTEEVHGGLADLNAFRKFLRILKEGLIKRGLVDVWPCFIVGKVGTDLHTTTFDPATAKRLVDIARVYGSYIKGHYTDYVSNPEEYPKVGIGAANVGPEFSEAEFESLRRLTEIEDNLSKERKIPSSSCFMNVLVKSVIESNRWRKWLLGSEIGKDFSELSSDRQRWLLRTGSRYVWTEKSVVEARSTLYRNLLENGINGEEMVLRGIDKIMEKYFLSFNLKDSISKIEEALRN